MHLQRIVCSVFLFCLATTAMTQDTHYFTFESNYWVNLHHFLLQQATNSQIKNLQADSLIPLDIGEDKILSNLSASDSLALEECVAWYDSAFKNKSVRRDLSDLLGWLQRHEEGDVLTQNDQYRDLAEVLNRAHRVYSKGLWQRHAQHNLEILTLHLPEILTLEREVIQKMENLSGRSWPEGQRVRVDLTIYANYAGAYTVINPELNIILSTIDPLSHSTSFVETIFHEGSHVLYPYGESPFRNMLFERVEASGMRYPKGLWHAAMFYLCGRATQDAYAHSGREHTLLMDERSIYTNYNTEEFRAILESFYLGETDMSTTISRLLTHQRDGRNLDD